MRSRSRSSAAYPLVGGVLVFTACSVQPIKLPESHPASAHAVEAPDMGGATLLSPPKASSSPTGEKTELEERRNEDVVAPSSDNSGVLPSNGVSRLRE